jgi:hypothetical protein
MYSPNHIEHDVSKAKWFGSNICDIIAAKKLQDWAQSTSACKYVILFADTYQSTYGCGIHACPASRMIRNRQSPRASQENTRLNTASLTPVFKMIILICHTDTKVTNQAQHVDW